jgi:hypothetical protein
MLHRKNADKLTASAAARAKLYFIGNIMRHLKYHANHV